MMNQSLIIGRIANDPELKETEKGKVSNITLAVQRSFKNANGEYETDFFPVAIWNGIAETTSQYCRKGDLIGVKGRLQSKDNVISINGNKDDKDINLKVYNNNKFISNVSLGDNNISVTGEDNFNISYSDNKLVLSFVYDKYKVESNIYFSKIDNISKFDYSNSVNITDIDSNIIDKFINVFKKSKIIKLLGE